VSSYKFASDTPTTKLSCCGFSFFCSRLVPVTADNGEKVVVWTNAVCDARYSLSVPEQRLILWLAAQIEREDDALDYRTIGVLEMQELLQGNNGRLYEQLEAVCDNLQSRVLEIRLEGCRIRDKINWLHRVRYNDGEGTVTLRFHDDLAPALLQIKKRFAQIPLKMIFRLRGGYAIRWYEMLVAKKYLETFSMSADEIRAWLGIEEHELATSDELRRIAIKVPKAELDRKADMTFTYTPTKVGRRVTGWIFKVRENHPRPTQRQLPLSGAAEIEKEAQLALKLGTAETRWERISMPQKWELVTRMDLVSQALAPREGKKLSKGFLLCLIKYGILESEFAVDEIQTATA
jgi:plasmid replication initiation protein